MNDAGKFRSEKNQPSQKHHHIASKTELTRAAAAASEPSFHEVWDNPEDDAYDTAFEQP